LDIRGRTWPPSSGDSSASMLNSHKVWARGGERGVLGPVK